MNTSVEIDDIMLALLKYTDTEINDCLNDEFTEEEFLSGIDVQGLYILLNNAKEISSGLEVTEFDLREL